MMMMMIIIIIIIINKPIHQLQQQSRLGWEQHYPLKKGGGEEVHQNYN
jgi:hypothetical protein